MDTPHGRERPEKRDHGGDGGRARVEASISAPRRSRSGSDPVLSHSTKIADSTVSGDLAGNSECSSEAECCAVAIATSRDGSRVIWRLQSSGERRPPAVVEAIGRDDGGERKRFFERLLLDDDGFAGVRELAVKPVLGGGGGVALRPEEEGEAVLV